MKKVVDLAFFLSMGAVLASSALADAPASTTTVASVNDTTTTSTQTPASYDASGPADLNVNQATTDNKSNPFSLDHFYLGLYSNIEGSKLNDIGTPNEVSATGQQTGSPMTFATDLTAAYMVTPTIGVGTYIEVNITPVLGQGFQWLDVGLTAFNRKLVSHNGLTIFANAIVEAPVDSYDISRGMILGLETTPYIRYELPNSRFSVGAWTELKNYTGSTSGKLVKTYYEPYVSYQILPQLSANISYELEYDYFAHSTGMSVYETDVQPGVLLYISHNFMFNPYVQFFTNNRLTMDSAAFGASIVARVL